MQAVVVGMDEAPPESIRAVVVTGWEEMAAAKPELDKDDARLLPARERREVLQVVMALKPEFPQCVADLLRV